MSLVLYRGSENYSDVIKFSRNINIYLYEFFTCFTWHSSWNLFRNFLLQIRQVVFLLNGATSIEGKLGLCEKIEFVPDGSLIAEEISVSVPISSIFSFSEEIFNSTFSSNSVVCSYLGTFSVSKASF